MTKRKCKHCPTMIPLIPGKVMCHPCKKKKRREYYEKNREKFRNSRDRYGDPELIKKELGGGTHITGGLFKNCSDIQRIALETGNVELLLRS